MSWKFTDELSITFQLSVSGAGEFSLKLNLYTYAVMCYIVVLSYTLLVTSVFFIHFVSHGNFTGIGVVKQQQRQRCHPKRGRIFSHFSSSRRFFYDWRRRLSWFLSRTNSHPFLMFYCANSTGCELGFSYSYIISYKNI